MAGTWAKTSKILCSQVCSRCCTEQLYRIGQQQKLHLDINAKQSGSKKKTAETALCKHTINWGVFCFAARTQGVGAHMPFCCRLGSHCVALGAHSKWETSGFYFLFTAGSAFISDIVCSASTRYRCVAQLLRFCTARLSHSIGRFGSFPMFTVFCRRFPLNSK